MRSPASAFDLRAALSEQVRAAIDAIAVDGGGDGESGGKAMRRCGAGLERARALARVGYSVAPGLSAVFDDSAGAILRALSDTRECAALAKTARALAKRSAKRSAKKAKKKSAAFELRATADALDTARESMPRIDHGALNAGLRDLLALAQVWPEPSARQLERGAERLARRARRAWRRGRDPDAPADRRHAWRLHENDRLHAAILLDDAWPRRRPRRRARNRRLVDLLARERDIALLVQRLEAAPPRDDKADDERVMNTALRGLRRRQARMAARVSRAGARLHRERG
jgi:hypothetical protein